MGNEPNMEEAQPVNADPPAYADTTNEAPPPSYDSIFGELREARRQTDGHPQFLKRVFSILCASVWTTIGIGIMMAIPVAMIVIGGLNLDKCTCERFIPIWLIVAGAAGIINQILEVCKRIMEKRTDDSSDQDEQSPSKFHSCFSGLLGCFNLAWFIAGNVWVYRNASLLEEPRTCGDGGSGTCDVLTYTFSFWLITSCYIIMAFFCCCGCCCIACFKK